MTRWDYVFIAASTTAIMSVVASSSELYRLGMMVAWLVATIVFGIDALRDRHRASG